ncbi:MAG: hypothetical protein U0520_02910 [Candidatus Saccharimonadales bacterium]
MVVSQNDIDLIDAVVAHRFGGDQERATSALTRLGEELERPGMPFYRLVGNNCLVFHTNTRAMDICEENPENYTGIIVDDFGVVLDPQSVAVGSFFRAAQACRSGIIHGWYGPSRVFYSNVSQAELWGCSVVSSSVHGKLFKSVINQSFIGALSNENLHANRSTVLASRAGNATLRNQVWRSGESEPADDTGDLTSYMLGRRGIYLPDKQARVSL